MSNQNKKNLMILKLEDILDIASYYKIKKSGLNKEQLIDKIYNRTN